MKIFLVWSGARSFAIAKALNDWLPRMIQAVKPFFSDDIDKGAKWSSEIDANLEGTQFGLVCLTADNLNSTWVHFEAGALSKTANASIWTYLSGINSADVPQPLGRFQHTLSTKSDTLRLVKTINKLLADTGGEPLSESMLKDNFDLLWPKLEKALNDAMDAPERTKAPKRNQEAMLEEIGR